MKTSELITFLQAAVTDEQDPPVLLVLPPTVNAAYNLLEVKTDCFATGEDGQPDNSRPVVLLTAEAPSPVELAGQVQTLQVALKEAQEEQERLRKAVAALLSPEKVSPSGRPYDEALVTELQDLRKKLNQISQLANQYEVVDSSEPS